MSDTWMLKGHKEKGVNSAPRFSMRFPWASVATITTADNTDVRAYRVGDDTFTDVADTLFPSGTHSYSGNQILLRAMSGGTAGETYVVAVAPTIDGMVLEYFFDVYVKQPDGS